MKMGRPQIGKQPRNKMISLKASEDEQKRIQAVCEKHSLTYLDVMLKGAEAFEKLDKKHP